MGGFWSQENQLKLNTEKGRKSLQFMLDLIYKYRAAPPQVSSFIERESYAYALQKDAPFFRGWSSFLKDMPISTADSAKVKNLGVSFLPHFDNNLPVTVFGGWNLMISKYSEKKAEAVEFINYILTEEVQKIMFETSGYLPILNSIYTDSTIVSNYPYIKYLENMMDYGIYRPSLVDYTKISDILSFYLNSVLKREMTVEQAMTQLDKTVTSDRHFLR
jgi:multiple sugar transport system substrate-binding protein